MTSSKIASSIAKLSKKTVTSQKEQEVNDECAEIDENDAPNL